MFTARSMVLSNEEDRYPRKINELAAADTVLELDVGHSKLFMGVELTDWTKPIGCCSWLTNSKLEYNAFVDATCLFLRFDVELLLELESVELDEFDDEDELDEEE